MLTKNRIGAPFGDAFLAGMATNYYQDFYKCKELAEYVDPMEPNEKNHLKYMEYFDIYKKIYINIKDRFKELSIIREK